jgi:16S rRNA (adenine1518-N6/adenine1519-N6)-dimethyltransferase
MPDTGTTLEPRSREDWVRILRRRGIRPSRALGQNFLVDPAVAREIVEVANVGPGDLVVEVGPGLGMLTRALIAHGANVTAIELDHELAAFLEQDLGNTATFRVTEQDALRVDLEAITAGSPYRVVANLPYSSGTAIVRRFLEASPRPLTMTVMLQREVAERMVAQPPSMSLLTLATAINADAAMAIIVPPDVFHPPPKVESAVVHLELREAPLATPAQQETLFRLATKAFQQKRKTLGNSLAQGLGITKQDAEILLNNAAIDPGRRPQTLTVVEWLGLATACDA